MRTLLAAFLIVLCPTLLFADEPERFPRPLTVGTLSTVCLRTATPIEIDGRIGDDEWLCRLEGGSRLRPDLGEFHDIQGPSLPLPRLRTHAMLMWDDDYLYIGARMAEPHVWATLTQRDAVIFHDNDFEIFIDPDGDTHQYYELEINALNTVWDLLLIRPYRDGGPAVDSWDIQGLRTAVHVDGTLNDPSDVDRGWSVEIAIPWEVLGECTDMPTPPHPGDTWRMNFSRVQWRTDIVDGEYVKRTHPETGKPLPEDNWVWSPQGLINMHYPEMWGLVTFSDNDPDQEPNAPERAVLQSALRRVYYAQRDHHIVHGRYAETMQELGTIDAGVLAAPPEGTHPWPPTLVATGSHWSATLSHEGYTATIDHEGRCRVERRSPE